MALHEMKIDWKHISTFATEKTLMRRIEQDKQLYPEHYDRYVIVRTPEGRWTIIIRLDLSNGGYVGRYNFLKI